MPGNYAVSFRFEEGGWDEKKSVPPISEIPDHFRSLVSQPLDCHVHFQQFFPGAFQTKDFRILQQNPPFCFENAPFE